MSDQMTANASASLCCHVSSLGGQQSNTSGKSGNTAGNTRATQAPKAPSLLEIARNKLGNTRATQGEIGRQHKSTYPQACVAYVVKSIPADLAALIGAAAQFYAYSPDDLASINDLARLDPAGLRAALLADPLAPYMGDRTITDFIKESK